MKKFLLILYAIPAFGALTTIQQTFNTADGGTCSGTISITYPTFISVDGNLIQGGTISKPVTAGVLNIQLEPGSYTVDYLLQPNGCAPIRENWLVPVTAGGPVNLATIRTLAPPVPLTLIPLEFLSQSGATTNQVPVWNGARWVPGAGGGGGGGSGCVPGSTLGKILVDSGSGACNSTTPTISGSTITGNLLGNVMGNVTGNVTGSSGSTTGNAATASALDHNPAPCPPNQFVSDVSATVLLICSQLATTNLSDNSIVVKTNQSNTYSAGDQDFRNAVFMEIPVGAGATATVNGRLVYDSTGDQLHASIAATDRVLTFRASATAFVTGNCLQAAGPSLMSDSGSPCGGGGTGITTLTGDVTAGPGSGSQVASVVATHLAAGLPRAQGGLNSTSAGTGLLRDGTTPAASELSGDATTSGSNAVTVVKVNGVSHGTSPATNTVAVVTGSNTTTYEPVPNAAIANPSITVNATGCLSGPGAIALGATGTVTSAACASMTRTVVSFSATPTFTRSTNLQIWELTLTGNVTSSTTSGLAAADVLVFKLCQDGTGGRTFAWPTGFSAASAPSSTLSTCTQQSFYWDGSAAVPITTGISNNPLDNPIVVANHGTSRAVNSLAEVYVCTGACTVTPVVPFEGNQLCVQNDDNVAGVITLAAISGVQYENTSRLNYKTANTALTSTGAVKDQICIMGRDATHYNVWSSVGTWN